MPETTIFLRTEKDLRVYMHPLRQKILRQLGLHPQGMTAKQLADILHIAPSSAGHHLAALERIGVAELSRTQRIHGILAKYYTAVNATVSMAQVEEDAGGARRAVLQNTVNEVFNRWAARADRQQAAGRPLAPGSEDMFTGIAHLCPLDAQELSRRIRHFVKEHAVPGEGTVPYEYALIAYRADDEAQHGSTDAPKGPDADPAKETL